MKLSELSTDRALDVLCELTPYVSSIFGDEKVIVALDGAMPKKKDAGESKKKKTDAPDDAGSFSVGVRTMSGLVGIAPLLLKTHRPDVYGILAVLNEKTVQEVASQPVGDTIRQVKDVFRDSELLDFFKSSAQQEKTEPTAPSASAPA